MESDGDSEDSARSSAPLARLEVGAGVLLTAWAIVLHVVFFLNAGDLWRDEISSVNLATLDSWSATLRENRLDSFPVGWPLLLRTWIELGLGASDRGLRALGLCVGIGALAAVWWCARRFAHRVPLLALALLALNPTLFLFGDTLRGYGVGVVALLGMIVCTWRVVEDPRPRVIAVAALVALVGVQCMYPNSVMLLALSIAGCAICVRERRRKPAIALLAIGLVAVVSMLPYLATFARHREWTVVVQTEVTPASLAHVLLRAMDGCRPGMVGVWMAAYAAALVGWLARERSGATRDTGQQTGGDRRELAFLAIASITAFACHGAYLALLSVTTQVWYYLAPLVVASVFADAGVHALVRSRTAARLARVACVLVLAAWGAPPAWNVAHTRMSSVGAAARVLEREAGASDLILVTPWYALVSFDRYYTGRTRWMSVPDFDERRFQPYAQFKERMATAKPMAPVLEAIRDTLRAGREVWVVGTLPELARGAPPGDIAPAPHPVVGWSQFAYTSIWLRQVSRVLADEAASARGVKLDVIGPFFPYETLPITRYAGRK